MKRKLVMAVCCTLLLNLWGCSADGEPAQNAATVQTEAVAIAPEPMAEEPEEIRELVIIENYSFRAQAENGWYLRYIYLCPNSGYYETWGGILDDRHYGSYSEDAEGRITLEIGGEPCVFRRTEAGLLLESGTLTANNESGEVTLAPGTESSYGEDTTLRDGIHALDTSEYEVAFDDVLLDIDLTERKFTIKCFDGNVVSGELSFVDDCLVCTYKDGKMMFHIWHNANGYELTSARYSPGIGDIPGTSLMFSPQLKSSMTYKFHYAENQGQEIAADPESVPLDSYKHLYEDVFRFTAPAYGEDGQKDQHPYHFFIRHYPLADMWEFQLYTKPHLRSVLVEAAETPDGDITFSLEGAEWNFHREEDGLRFDGGSPMIVGNWNDVTGQNYYEMELPVGTVIQRIDQSYLYDALYILPGKTLEEAYAGIQIDTGSQWLRIQCSDGRVLKGPYTYGNEYTNSYIIFTCEIPDYIGTRTAEVMLRPHGHSLWTSDQWMLKIGPGGMNTYDSYYFIPAVGVLPPENSEE